MNTLQTKTWPNSKRMRISSIITKIFNLPTNALRAEEGTKRQIVDTELFYNYGFHVSFLR